MGREGAGRIQIKYQEEMKKLLLVICILTIDRCGLISTKNLLQPNQH